MKQTITNRKPRAIGKPELDDAALERLADGFLFDYEYDEKRMTPLIGFLQYLRTVANERPRDVEDIVWKVSQRMLGKTNDDALEAFQKDALRSLLQTLRPA